MQGFNDRVWLPIAFSLPFSCEAQDAQVQTSRRQQVQPAAPAR